MADNYEVKDAIESIRYDFSNNILSLTRSAFKNHKGKKSQFLLDIHKKVEAFERVLDTAELDILRAIIDD